MGAFASGTYAKLRDRWELISTLTSWQTASALTSYLEMCGFPSDLECAIFYAPEKGQKFSKKPAKRPLHKFYSTGTTVPSIDWNDAPCYKELIIFAPNGSVAKKGATSFLRKEWVQVTEIKFKLRGEWLNEIVDGHMTFTSNTHRIVALDREGKWVSLNS